MAHSRQLQLGYIAALLSFSVSATHNTPDGMDRLYTAVKEYVSWWQLDPCLLVLLVLLLLLLLHFRWSLLMLMQALLNTLLGSINNVPLFI